jgi:glycosyltransferase involved in cell wall biosynthesis
MARDRKRNGALLEDRMPTLIAFSHLRWDFVYHRPQHLLSRLAKRFDVRLVEEPVRTEGDAWLERAQMAPGVTVLKAHTPIDAPGFDHDQLPVLERLLSEHVRDSKIDDCIAWFYTPMALPLLSILSPRAVVYDCVDGVDRTGKAPSPLRPGERALLERADLVFADGPSLYEAKRSLHPRVVCLPSAVDASPYLPERAALQAGAVAQARRILDGIGRPRLGYFGVIDERVDIDLVTALADADRAWQIVMVGPVVGIDPAGLPRRPNIHWLGEQPRDVLPQIVADWDVCLLPLALNEPTRYLKPTRALQYMAARKPVVGTALHDLVTLYGTAVRIGIDTAAFVDLCRRALAESEAARQQRLERMAALVADHTWDRAAEQARAAIEQLLAVAPPGAHAASPASPACAALPAASAAGLAQIKMA